MKTFCIACLLSLLALICHAQTDYVGERIVLGQSASFSGSFAEQAASYRDGALLYFDEVNRHGGIHGRRIELISLDDQYKVDLMLANTHKLVEEDKVFALFNYTWTPMARAAIPLATDMKVPFFAPYTGANDVYQSDSKYVFTIRASFREELDAMVRHLTTIGRHKLALVRYTSKTGEEFRAELLPILNKYGATLVGEGTMVINTANAADAVAQLAKVEAQAIILGVSGADAVAFVRGNASNEGNSGHIIPYYARSLIGAKQLAKDLGEQALGISVTQLVPNPAKQSSLLTQEYARLVAKKGLPLGADYIALEGFIAAKVFCEALQRTGPKLTRNTFMDTMTHLGRVDIGGYVVSFSPDKHNGSDYVSMTMIGRNGKVVD